MYTKEETRQIRKAFWTTFGQYLKPIPSATGLKVNWINYKTGLRDLYFRMHVDKRSARIGIYLEQKDPVLRELFYEQLLELRSYLHSEIGEEWTWEPNAYENGRSFSRVYIELPEVNIFNQQDWPKIITFLKPRIIALDGFWEMAQLHFEPLK